MGFLLIVSISETYPLRTFHVEVLGTVAHLAKAQKLHTLARLPRPMNLFHLAVRGVEGQEEYWRFSSTPDWDCEYSLQHAWRVVL